METSQISESQNNDEECLVHEDAQAICGNPSTRFFLVKSFNSENVSAALKYNCWATSLRNEHAFTKILESSPHLILIFSINGSSRFSGFARMLNRPGDSTISGSVFSAPDGKPFRGRTFDIEWICRAILPFNDSRHIRNSLNEQKPVKIGRDGQEVCPIAASELCQMMCSRGGTFDGDENPGRFSASESNNRSQSQPPNYSLPEESPNEPPSVEPNPVLKIFPIDLTNMAYDEYRKLYEASKPDTAMGVKSEATEETI